MQLPVGDRAGSPDPLAGRVLYLCTPDRPDLGPFLRACLRGGVDVVQLRDKRLPARSLVTRAILARQICDNYRVPFVLNDRPDLALECGAAGVHVGQDDVLADTARRILGERAIVGLSTHASDQLDAAGDEPVNYISAGPVNPTPTKPGRPGTGLGYLRYAAANAKVPWFVTGGVTPDTIPEMAAAGAKRFVVVRYLTESPDPLSAARRLKESILAATDARL